MSPYAYVYTGDVKRFWEAARRSGLMLDRGWLAGRGPWILELWAARGAGSYVLTLYVDGGEPQLRALAGAILGPGFRVSYSLSRLGVETGRGPLLRKIYGQLRLAPA